MCNICKQSHPVLRALNILKFILLVLLKIYSTKTLQINRKILILRLLPNSMEKEVNRNQEI